MLANKISLIPGIFDINGIRSNIKLSPNNIKTVFIAKSGCIITDET